MNDQKGSSENKSIGGQIDKTPRENDQHQQQTFNFIDISNIKNKDFALEMFIKIVNMISKQSYCSPRLKAISNIDIPKHPSFFTSEFQKKLQFYIFQFLMSENNDDIFECTNQLGLLLQYYFEQDP